MCLCLSSVVRPCGLQAETNVSDKNIVSIFSPEDGGNVFLRNASICLQIHMVLLHRKPTSTTEDDCLLGYYTLQSGRY
jgi:hypothetical protein